MWSSANFLHVRGRWLLGNPCTICLPVRTVARKLGWQETTSADFDILWTDTSIGSDKLARLHRHQAINHFPNMLALCRKADCHRNLERMAQRFPQHYNFVPRTYIIPARLHDFLAELRRKHAAGPPTTFIIKPSTGSQVCNASTAHCTISTHRGVESGWCRPQSWQKRRCVLRVPPRSWPAPTSNHCSCAA